MTDTAEWIRELVTRVCRRPALAAAQTSPLFEHWLAVELQHEIAQQYGWFAHTQVPYVTETRTRAKWADVYARHFAKGKTQQHVWFELKAVPFRSKGVATTSRDAAQDLDCLRAMNRSDTSRLWQTYRNPRDPTEEGLRTWLEKLGPIDGSLSEGRHLGVALAFVNNAAFERCRSALDRIVSGNRIVRVVDIEDIGIPAPRGTVGSLGAVGYLVRVE